MGDEKGEEILLPSLITTRSTSNLNSQAYFAE
jgi:hypothetical protein